MASLPRRGKLTVGCLRSPPRSPSPNHPRDVAGNPDASRCFVGRDSDRPAPHGSPDRGGWPGSAARPRAGRRAEPSVHSLVRSKSGHGRSGCRPAPEFGSARTETVGQSSPPRATAHMDAFGNDWNTAPACVLSTVWGTASIRDLAVEVGAVPASPIRQVLTACRAGCAGPKSSAPASLWICGQHKSVAHNPTGPTAAADNLNDLEISSVSATPGSPPQRQPAWALLPFRHLYAGSDSRSHFSLGELNAAIAELVTALNNRVTRHLGASRRALFDDLERSALKKLPAEWLTKNR